MTDNDNVVPIRARESSAPDSAVVPVARKISGAFTISPSDARLRAFRELTDAAARAYEAAAAHRLAGDEAGAELLVEAAAEAMSQAQAVGEELARL